MKWKKIWYGLFHRNERKVCSGKCYSTRFFVLEVYRTYNNAKNYSEQYLLEETFSPLRRFFQRSESRFPDFDAHRATGRHGLKLLGHVALNLGHISTFSPAVGAGAAPHSSRGPSQVTLEKKKTITVTQVYGKLAETTWKLRKEKNGKRLRNIWFMLSIILLVLKKLFKSVINQREYTRLKKCKTAYIWLYWCT